MDLRGAAVAVTGATGFLGRYITDVLLARGAHVIGVVRNPGRVPELAARGVERSEEHTSELQSRLHLVCRLLLEKKKNITSKTLPMSTEAIGIAELNMVYYRSRFIERSSSISA